MNTESHLLRRYRWLTSMVLAVAIVATAAAVTTASTLLVLVTVELSTSSCFARTVPYATVSCS